MWTYWYQKRTYKGKKDWRERSIKDGLWTYWYKDGQKRREENWKDGEIIELTEYNVEGAVKSEP